MFARFDLSALSRRRSAKFVLACFLAAVALTLVTFTARAWRDKKSSAARKDAVAARPTRAANTNGHIRRGRLWPQLQGALIAFGDRLERPGKERLVLIGTLSRTKNEQFPVRLILEHPDKLRLEEPDGITVFDGKSLKSSKNNFGKKEEDEIESLLSDSTEHFFAGQMIGQATLALGQRFRVDDGSTPNYQGPYYDIYQVEDRPSLQKELGRQTKLYYFNSDTLLLERVRYEERSSKTKVEVRLSNWQRVNGQLVAGKINRLEDGVPMMSLTINTAAIGAMVTDGIFSRF
jgi:hypothetical protein